MVGLAVSAVPPRGFLARLGLSSGCIIRRVNGSAIDSPETAEAAVRALAKANEATGRIPSSLSVRADCPSGPVAFDYDVGPEAATPPQEAGAPEHCELRRSELPPGPGATFEPRYLGERRVSGLIVVRVEAGGLFDHLGVAEGDVVMAVNNYYLDSPEGIGFIDYQLLTSDHLALDLRAPDGAPLAVRCAFLD